MKIKFSLILVILSIFLIACQAGMDNRTVYESHDADHKDNKNESYEIDDHDDEKSDDHDGHDHDDEKDEDHDANDHDDEKDEDHDGHDHDDEKDEDHEDGDHADDEKDEDHKNDKNSNNENSYYNYDEEETYEDELNSISVIDDPSNISWPRIVTINDRKFTIESRPERVATISLGHDEILFGISDTNQIVATTSFAQDDGSNIQSKADGLPTISSDPETIISVSPEIIFADPYASVELIDALENAGIIVIQTQLDNSIEGRKNDVWLMSYITGNLSNAKILTDRIDNNIKALQNIKSNNSDVENKLITLSWWDAYWTAGIGSTEDSVITLGGGDNLSALNGVESNSTIDKELLISMNPEIILITQSVTWGGKDFYDQLFSDDSLSSINAIKNNKVHMVNSNWWGTLSYWNLKGSEELAKILYELESIEGFEQFE
ncbi:MAG: ABC transporter substrate-binding protein [SAR202 cluster bacterium]|nr:ABC transporter substrate-binding protein [SAR202 cluster bacterium]